MIVLIAILIALLVIIMNLNDIILIIIHDDYG